ncbi:transposable element Tcb2 transposase [Trichonephila clavipes]|nr:transposable element Tcb2 transposase [Trichonephila clavipes]
MSTMSHRSHLTDSEAWGVVGRLKGGQTQAEVAQAIGVSQSVISRIWNCFLETGSAERKPGQGRRRARTPNKDRYLVLTARRHQNMNAILLQHSFALLLAPRFQLTTVRNRIHGVGMYARRPMEGIVRMEWPACSPDINPINHVWNALGRRVAGLQPPPQTLQELEEWGRMP